MTEHVLTATASHLCQLSAQSIVVAPIVNSQHNLIDFQLKIAPMFRGGPKVGQLVINNPVDININPAQYSQHFINLPWANFQQICAFANDDNSKLLQWSVISKDQLIQQLRQKYDDSHGHFTLQLSFMATGALALTSFGLQIADATSNFNFDAQVDDYTRTKYIFKQTYRAIRWSNVSAPVSTQSPTWYQYRTQLQQSFSITQVMVKPIGHLDAFNIPDNVAIQFLPMQKNVPLLGDDTYQLTFMSNEAHQYGKDGPFQIMSLIDFNRLLKLNHHAVLPFKKLVNLPFEVVSPDSHFETPQLLPFGLDNWSELECQSATVDFACQIDNKALNFRYVDIQPMGHQVDAGTDKAEFAANFQLQPASISFSTLHKLVAAGVNEYQEKLVDSNNKTLSSHQILISAIDIVLQVTQLNAHLRANNLIKHLSDIESVSNDDVGDSQTE